MKFKAGDRVHVTRYNGEDVDFYGTLSNIFKGIASLVNCSDETYEEIAVYILGGKFGETDEDYFTLATDEEDTEPVEVQHTNDSVNHPSHYNFGDIEVVDFIEQVTKHYNSDVAYHIGNAIKYISRAPHKNGKEDIAKAKWSIERAYKKWD